MGSHFNDMYPVHTVKICCPGALFPLVVGVVGVISWYLGEAGACSLDDTEQRAVTGDHLPYGT